MVDTIMVGRLGATELAGVAFAGSVSMNVLVFGMGIAMALTPLTGQGYARKEHKKISMLFQNSLALNTIIGLIIIGILFLIFPFLSYFGQPQEVIDICKPYYIIIMHHRSSPSAMPPCGGAPARPSPATASATPSSMTPT